MTILYPSFLLRKNCQEVKKFTKINNIQKQHKCLSITYCNNSVKANYKLFYVM